MRILYLGKDLEFSKFLGTSDEVLMTDESIDKILLIKFNPDLIVSYNYRHILNKEIFSYPKLGTINMHISYLPYNRGADPNLWSHLGGTPTGVSIHLMDEGIDTGPIICQKLIPLSEDLNLSESWQILQNQIKELFKENFEIIKSGKYKTYFHNKNVSTYHQSKQRPSLENGFETKIKYLS